MQFSAILALAASIASVSASTAHSNLHKRVHARDVSKRGYATVQANSNLQTLAAAGSPDVQEGSGLQYVNTIINNSTDDAQVYFWEAENFSLIKSVYNENPSAPALIISLPAGSTQTVSFSNQFSGAYGAVWPDTITGNAGNFKIAYVELTTKDQWGAIPTVDMSFEPNMKDVGHSVSTDTCKSMWNSCAFQCTSSDDFCGEAGSYALMDSASPDWTCMIGTFMGQASGGCQLSSTFTTTFLR